MDTPQTYLKILALKTGIDFLSTQIDLEKDYVDSIERDYVEISSDEVLKQAKEKHEEMVKKRDWMTNKLIDILLGTK